MYLYFNGLVIREGTEGVPADYVEALFEDAGWARNTPSWQKEKFSLIFSNSTWAFTVWDNDKMIGMVRVISDKIMAANILDLVVLSDYRGKGYATECLNYAKQIAENTNCYKMMLLTGSKKKEILNFYGNARYNSTDKTAFIQWLE